MHKLVMVLTMRLDDKGHLQFWIGLAKGLIYMDGPKFYHSYSLAHNIAVSMCNLQNSNKLSLYIL